LSTVTLHKPDDHTGCKCIAPKFETFVAAPVDFHPQMSVREAVSELYQMTAGMKAVVHHGAND
jgi:hypothetical protein